MVNVNKTNVKMVEFTMVNVNMADVTMVPEIKVKVITMAEVVTG